MTYDDTHDGRNPQEPANQGRRDFARSALAAGGALLIAPKVMAAAQPGPPGAGGFSKYIYFYYVTPGSISHPRVRAYFVEDSVAVGNMAMRVGQLVADAKSGNLTPLGFGMGSLIWCRQSYLVVVLDIANHKLLAGKGLTFEDTIPGGGHGAHTFKRGADVAVAGMSGWYCENHLKKRNPNNPNAPTDLTSSDFEQYKVSVNIVGPMALSIERYAATLGHYETGTNTGPPP